MPNAAAPACSVAFSGAASTPRVEKKFAKSTVGPAIPAARPPTQSIWATFFPARSAALAIVSAWRMPAPENDVRFENASPVRWKVLFVEPCSLDHVPVAIVYQPTPVLGGNACSMPLAPLTPSCISPAYVGMAPSAAYFSIKSGRIPSDENSSVFLAMPTTWALSARAVPVPSVITNTRAVAAFDLLEGLPGRDGHDLDQVRDARLRPPVVADFAPGVGDGGFELLPDHVGLVEHPHDALRGQRRARRHLALRLLQVHHARAHLGVLALGHPERLAEPRVEALRDVTRELEMLPLVVADRDQVGLVEEDVPCHQHGIREEPSRDEFLTLSFFFELRHPSQLPVARHGREQPSRLGVRADVALREDRRPLGVEARCNQHREEIERRVVQLLRGVLGGDRVQVDDAEEGIAHFLGLCVLAEAAGVVAERLRSCGLDAAEDAHGRDSIVRDGPLRGVAYREGTGCERVGCSAL